MPKLTIKKKAEVVAEIHLDISRTAYTIGSESYNDVVLQDKKVSIRHVRIGHAGGQYYVEDLKSAFGTRLNGRPLQKRQQIVDGDEIALGEHTIVFENTLHRPVGYAGLPLDEENAERRLDLDLANGPQPQESGVPREPDNGAGEPPNSFESEYRAQRPEQQEPTNGEASDGDFFLLAIYGPYLGKKYSLSPGDTRIGRDVKLNDIVIRHDEQGRLDPSISRRHATVSFKPGEGFVISDKRSKTRTYVNQRKLEPEDEVPLQVGDEIEIVSDQKSTIFRLARGDRLDFAPPRRAGTRWLRTRRPLGLAAALIVGAISLIALYTSARDLNRLQERPERVETSERLWFAPEAGAPAEGGRSRTLALADLSGDGRTDAVFADANGHLVAVDGHTQTPLWQKSDFRVHAHLPFVVDQVNQNSAADVVVVGSDSRVRALDGSLGAEIWISPILGGALTSPPAVADLNGDGLKDVAIGSQDGTIHLGYAHLYGMTWERVQTDVVTRGVLSVQDWDGDGGAEVFIGTEDGRVVILSGRTGDVTAVFDFHEVVDGPERPQAVRHPVALADLNANGIPDLLITSTQGYSLALEGRTSQPLWQQRIEPGDPDNFWPASALGDLDGDDVADALLASSTRLRAVHGSTASETAVLWEYAPEETAFATPPVLADVNNDGAADVAVVTHSGEIVFLDGPSGVPLHRSRPTPGVVSPLRAADLGGDAYLDFVFIGNDFNIYHLATNGPVAPNSVLWGQTYGTPRHTGRILYERPDPVPYRLSMLVACAALVAAFGVPLILKNRRQRRMENNRGLGELPAQLREATVHMARE